MRTQDGLTLIELLTTVAIVAILAVVAVPSFKTMSAQNRMVSNLNDLVADLQYARSEAIKRGRDVVVCPANSRFTKCRATSDWSQGWIVRDLGDSSATPKISPKVLRIHEPLRGGDTLRESDRRNVDTAGKIVFNRNGFSPNARTIQICPANNNAKAARAIVITTIGRIHAAYDSDEDGVVENGSGKNISCGE